MSLQKRAQLEPVVGWLVCIEGLNRGRDYCVRSGQNSIGRAPENDICISGDPGISRERHVLITYDSATRTFCLTPGYSRALARVNGHPLLSSTPLKLHDQIELGVTKLLFVPFCGDAFSWTNAADDLEKNARR